MKTKFTEIQKFTQWWVWLIMALLLLLPVYAFLSGGLSDALKSSPIILVIILFWMLKLKTRVDLNGVNMVYFPFVSKFVEWGEIKKVSVIDYGFVGGWGIRLWTKYGTVYNVSGSKGLFIELESGKTFLVGSQKEEELKTVLKELGKTE
jgi:hypothetical protein